MNMAIPQRIFSAPVALWKKPWRLVLLCTFLFLSGCNEELYTGLSEKEGNEMLSILLKEGIAADKVSQSKGQLVNLEVARSELSRAIGVLKSHGYPRDQFSSVGELFQKDGLISSPLEERARYIYGRSQEIADTLSQLDGVITARVHVVMPEESARNAAPKEASASVFLKHASHVKMDDFVPQIKMLVNNGIEGLRYDNISVALFPAQTLSHGQAQPTAEFLSVRVEQGSINQLYLIFAVLLVLLTGALAGNLIQFLRSKKTGQELVSR